MTQLIIKWKIIVWKTNTFFLFFTFIQFHVDCKLHQLWKAIPFEIMEIAFQMLSNPYQQMQIGTDQLVRLEMEIIHSTNKMAKMAVIWCCK